MAQYIFKMPDIGEGVVEGEVVAWHVKPGDFVKEDQPLVDIMTDKATVTIPSTIHGTIVRTNGKMGEMIAVGRELIVMETDAAPRAEAEHTSAKAPPVVAPSKSAPPPAPVSLPTSKPTSTPIRNPGERPMASPAVRRMAKEASVDLFTVSGTGPAGRISRDDLQAHIAGGSRSIGRTKRSGTTEIPVIGLRRKIAEKMALSKRQIPHFSYFEEVDVTQLEDLREHLNEQRPENGPKLTYLPFIMQALAKALSDHPECNAHFDEARGVVVQHKAIHLGVATQTERGLLVPVIRNVESLDLWQGGAELRRVVDAARKNTAKIDELSGSTFTLTSLGALGGLGATPIINHPEVGILGVHKADERAVVRRGKIVVRRMLNLSSSFDHRVVDGADGASLVQAVKRLLEHPATIFMP